MNDPSSACGECEALNGKGLNKIICCCFHQQEDLGVLETSTISLSSSLTIGIVLIQSAEIDHN